MESVRAEYMAALAQEQSLTGALNAQKSEALGLNRKGIEYTVLQREAESNRQVYESLLQRTKETGISGELKSSNIRVVDPAEVPTNPVLPRRSNDLMMALLAGSVLALGLVFLFEYLDNRIKSPQELRALNLAFLGMVPKIDNSGPTLLNDAVPPAFGEAIRAVRTNVLFSSADGGRAHGRRDECRAGRGEEPRSPATCRYRSRRPASACCTSTPTCGGPASTTSSTCRRSPASPTCSSATASRAKRSARPALRICACCPQA